MAKNRNHLYLPLHFWGGKFVNNRNFGIIERGIWGWGRMIQVKFYRQIVSLFIAVVLVCTSALPSLAADGASDASDPRAGLPAAKVLYIYDKDQIDFIQNKLEEQLTQFYQDLFREQEVEATFISMKQFVALREELNGKYDLIMFGKGNYYPLKVNIGLNTYFGSNDITQYKAEQIIQFYLDKGIPVLLPRAFTSDNYLVGVHREGNIKKVLGPYWEEHPERVLFYRDEEVYGEKNIFGVITSVKDRDRFIGDLRTYMDANPRPYIQLLDNPISYKDSTAHYYSPENEIKFNFSIPNEGKFQPQQLKVKLFIDFNYNHQYEETEAMDEVIVSSNLEELVRNKDGTYTLSYQLPHGYSGLYYWKLNIIDESSQRQDYVENSFRFRDHLTKIKVLQVKKNLDDLDLKADELMAQNLLESEDYQIETDAVTYAEFCESTHEQLNGNYNMVIFGFKDLYNSKENKKPERIPSEVLNSINQYIASGQSVMFTHDSIYAENWLWNPIENDWTKNFRSIIGQTDTWDSMGLNAFFPSTKAIRVNQGLITQYPFLLPEQITVSNTHNQYFQLDLEDPSIIPWFNIDNDSIFKWRDNVYDTWHHYYTYSKGNITFSGSGHLLRWDIYRNVLDPPTEDEQKLLVNTIYRAFMGSNHAPIISVLSPQLNDGNEVSHSPEKTIHLKFRVDDYDFKDHWINKVEVNINHTSQTVGHSLQHKYQKVTKGSTISLDVSPKDLQLTEFPPIVPIRIEAWDQSGAKDQVEFVLVTEPFNLLSSPKQAYLPLNTDKSNQVELSYTIGANRLVNQPFDLKNATFLPMVIKSNELQQYGVNEKIAFKVNEKKNSPQSAEGGASWFWVKTEQKGNNSTYNFASIDFLEALKNGKVELDPSKNNPGADPSGKNDVFINFPSNMDPNAKLIVFVVDDFDLNNNGSNERKLQLRGFAQLGEAEAAKDGNKNFKVQNYTLFPYGDWSFSLQLPEGFEAFERPDWINVQKNDQGDLLEGSLPKDQFSIDPNTLMPNPYTFQFKLKAVNREMILSQPAYPLHAYLKQEGESNFSQPFPEISLIPYRLKQIGPITLFQGQSKSISYEIQPKGCRPGLSFEITGPPVASIHGNYLIGKSPGTTRLIAKTTDGIPLQSGEVHVVGLNSADLELERGTGRSINYQLTNIRDYDQNQLVIGEEWSSSKPDILLVNNKGYAIALREGLADVTLRVMLQDPDNLQVYEYEKKIRVTVVPKKHDDWRY